MRGGGDGRVDVLGTGCPEVPDLLYGVRNRVLRNANTGQAAALAEDPEAASGSFRSS
ncbi:hypothetical protein ACOJVU_08245 [Mycobacterium sp. THU-M104]|uniref:hypothetical protein n=1 Tax=Mycobacterium sp. THU-M104 TaxID=3410515 RepID=UPI003B9A04A7